MKIAYITDSSSGILNNPEEHTYVVPLIILHTIAGETKQYLDNEKEITSKKLISLIEMNDATVTTSQASMGTLMELLEDLLKKYDRIFVLPIAKSLSNSYQTWKLVIDELNAKEKVYLLDTGSVWCGTQWYYQDLKDYLQKNPTASFKEIDKQFSNRPDKVCGVLSVSNYQQLVKGGRLSAFKAGIAKLVKLNLVIRFSLKDGKLTYNTTSKNDVLIEKMLNLIDEETKFKTTGIKRVAFATTYTDVKVEKKFYNTFLQLVSKYNIKESQVIRGSIPNVITSHLGSGTISIYLEAY